MTDYENRAEAQIELSQYLRYYIYERRHSALKYKSPAQFEQITNLSK